jgi:nicotinate-nucleotide pyrophosphorylase (carboxylating)
MQAYIDQHIRMSLNEDIGKGDYTTIATIPANQTGQATLLAKDNGILAGIDIAKRVFQIYDEKIEFIHLKNEGDLITPGDKLAILKGPSRSLLTAERLALNYAQRMSGIATMTRTYVDAIEGTGAKVLDTRKTTPNLRLLEKIAVNIGGGHNHRFGLFDMILIKDNHIDYAGGVDKALNQVNEFLVQNNMKLNIEIETRNFDEIEAVLSNGKCQRIMLDNFSVKDTKKAVKLINNRFEVETSGGINLETIRDYAECGVNFISVGALTHQMRSLDLSLNAEI